MNAHARQFVVGPLSFILEANSGFVREVRFHRHEILRGIYPAVRDERWGTAPAQVITRVAGQDSASIHLQLQGTVAAGEIAFTWSASILADANGKLRYQWHGRAQRDFQTNRTGLCVLHPIEVAGAPCVVEHTNGRRVASWFPHDISPHQPFSDIRAITHSIAGRAEVETRLDGDVFEMEDQRNWTDASFKTYCRPLDWPKPYRLSCSAAVEQSVMVTVRGTPAPALIGESRLEFTPLTGSSGIPAIGFTMGEPLSTRVRERIRLLRPDHLRVETTSATLPATVDWAVRECEAVGCTLVVALRNAAAPPARRTLPPRCTVQLFDAAGTAARPEIVAAWREAGFDSIATGSCRNFTELNRSRPSPSGEHTEVVFGINAQVHAFDDRSVLETVSVHNIVAHHAHLISAGRPISVAPLILGPAPESSDVRLATEFGAVWLLGSLAELGSAGVARVTFARTHGPGGILHDDCVTPIEELLRLLGSSERCMLVRAADPASPVRHAVLVAAAGQRTLLVPNASESPVEILTPWTGPLDVPSRTLGRFPLAS
jgi:hypothetical protein